MWQPLISTEEWLQSLLNFRFLCIWNNNVVQLHSYITLSGCWLWEESTKNPSHSRVWAGKGKCCVIFNYRKNKRLLNGGGGDWGVGCDNDPGVGARWNCWGEGLMRTYERNDGWFPPRVHFCQMFKEGQPIRYSERLMSPFSISALPAHHLLHQVCRCSSQHRLMFPAPLITAGVEPWIDLCLGSFVLQNESCHFNEMSRIL